MLRNDIHRIIDANINRASEALRVLEDWLRYGKNNKQISEKLKNIRHDLNNIYKLFPNLIMNRESINDAGREIENLSKRNSVRDIIKANCKRAEEAIRVLSEYGQLIELDTKELEKYRYEIYTLEKELLKNEKLLRLHNASLYLVASRDVPSGRLYDKEFLTVIEKAIEGDVNIIQLREKDESERKIISIAKEIKNLIKGTDILFIINDRVDIALACDADGIHLGQDDMPVNEARKITPEGFIIGLSTHNKEQGKEGLKSGADYLGIGPVFPTPTKPDYIAAGLDYVSWASNNLKDLPFFAIGGIDENNIEKVINAGAKRIAVVRAIMDSNDSLKTTKTLKSKLIGKNIEHATIR
ncbi:MAG: thiamine-phosphate diphosphorylase [Candidatus Melainabacteria bacterium RIFCSPHIGHO2_02_FULL_34_12]|nr:MAG: thiamine-phosphate diphosphorylase [Candidatus Melainabacteria bacterium RIFCSPHIGHO2_02_FULL_34_12]